MLTRDDILKQTDLPREAITAFGGEVYVRTLTGLERDAFEQAFLDRRKAGKPVNIRAALAVRVLCDDQGNRLFKDSDADAVGGLRADELDKVFTIAQRLNGLGAKDVETLEGN